MDRVRTRKLFSDATRTVTAVESLMLQTDRSHQGGFLVGSLKPIAIIVTEPDRTYALDMEARPVDIDQLDLPDDVEL